MAFLAGSIKVRTPFDSCKKPCTSSTLFNSILKRPIRAETNQNIPQKLWRRVEKSGFWRLIILQLLSLYESGTRGRLRLWRPNIFDCLRPPCFVSPHKWLKNTSMHHNQYKSEPLSLCFKGGALLRHNTSDWYPFFFEKRQECDPPLN